MSLFNSANPGFRVNVLPQFPGRVQATNGVEVVKQNGKWTFALDYEPLDIPPPLIPNPDQQFVVAWNALDDSWSRFSLSQMATSGDLDLKAIADLPDASTGYLAKIGANTWELRQIVVDANVELYGGLLVTNPAGVTANTTIGLANDLYALEQLGGAVGLSGGIACRKSDVLPSLKDTWVLRQLAAPPAGITVTNSDGDAGNITLGLNGDLAAIEGQTGFGFGVRRAADAWIVRTLTAGTGINISDPAGIAADPIISLGITPGPTVTRTDPGNKTVPTGYISSASGGPVANRLHAIPFHLSRSMTVTKIGFQVMALQTGGNARVGIYSDALGQPGAVQVDSGNVSTATTGVKEVAVNATIGPGTYWFAFVCDNSSTLLIRCCNFAWYPLGMAADLINGRAHIFRAFTYTSGTSLPSVENGQPYATADISTPTSSTPLVYCSA